MRIFVAIICSIVILSGCNMDPSEEEESPVNTTEESSTNEVQVDLKDVQYVYVDGDDTFNETDEDQMVKISIEVTNETNNEMEFYAQKNMKLEDDAKGAIHPIPSHKLPSSIDVSEFNMDPVIDEGDKKTFHSLFPVKQGNIYHLFVESSAEDEGITIDLDEYEQTLDNIKEPEKAMESYLHQVVLGKDDPEEADLVDIELEDEMEDAYAAFKKKMEDIIFYDVKEKEIEKLFEQYIPYVQEMSEVEVTTLSNTNSKAVVEVKYAALDHKKMLETVLKQEEIFNGLKEDEFVQEIVDLIPETYDDLALKEAREPMKISLEKKEDGWAIAESELERKEKLMRAFFAGGIR